MDEFWSLLTEERCAVTQIPPERFSLARFGHPRRNERGRSYTWAAGVLDNVWDFDPSVFGISPREAIQMDPQQRLLLQLTWEALEDAGIRPSSLLGADVGVYVGASQIDYAHSFLGDQAIADSHFATGTALAILANRISYIFDFRGPSVTVDTACSSSLVALHQAVEALRSGRIDVAVVGGTNVITSPASFIAFSQASMLSPTGLCQAFSANADGFVRAEGGGVVVLRRASKARQNNNPIRGLVMATDVNSDGRTSGISLPSLAGQEALLRRIYSRAELDPNLLAFVEAHGTGTAAGDPIEAAALGRGLGQRREKATPLPIGSVKTNIGHLEPGAGIAGLIKALLALNHRVLPPSLHCAELNPNIPFEDLNLTVATQSLTLGDTSGQIAGVNSFGFGGTNAHAVVAPGEMHTAKPHLPQRPEMFMASAENAPALAALANTYSRSSIRLPDPETAILAGAVAHRREHMATRLVVSAQSGSELSSALEAYASGGDHPALVTGTAVGRDLPVAFVYSGNGSQWVGMGVAAYRHNAVFRAHFKIIDELFKKLSGWSLYEMLFSDDLAEKLPLTSVAQPLVFAIQSATTAALRKRGFQPIAVLGHSVGEIAAAEAAGILDLPAAVDLVFRRSHHQERVHGRGRMMALRVTAQTAEDFLRDVDAVEIAAFNSPNGITIAGPADKLATFATENPGLVMVDLDLDYPFHTSQLDVIKDGLIDDLKNLRPSQEQIPFISTVTGQVLAGKSLGANYWWRNVRDPVQFTKALRAAAELGARFFFEIGARATLTRHILESLDGEVSGFTAEAAVDRKDEDLDPIERAIMRALVAGAKVDLNKLFGPNPGPTIQLPHYPWQQREFRFEHTVEAVANEPVRHPFAGSKLTPDGLEWRADVDTALYPELIDHRLGEQVLFPGTAFLEMALATAREWLKSDNVTIANFEIMKALDLTKGDTRELMTRVSPGSNTIEIFSRPRLSHAAWLQHCRGKMLHGNRAPGGLPPNLVGAGRVILHDDVYRISSETGLNYGPHFRLVDRMVVYDGDIVSVELQPQADQELFVLNPIRTDCCSHGTFAVFRELLAKERGVTYIPVRIDDASIYRPYATPASAIVEICDKSSRAISANYFILDSDGHVIAALRGVRCQAVTVRHAASAENLAVVEFPKLLDGAISGQTGVASLVKEVFETAGTLQMPSSGADELSAAQLFEGWAMSVAYEFAQGFSEDNMIDTTRLVTTGRIVSELRPWLENMLMRLAAAGLVRERAGVWSIVPDDIMPASALLVKNLASEHPAHGPELLLAGAFTGIASQVKADRALDAAPSSLLSAATLDFFNAGNAFVSAGAETLKHLARRLQAFWPERRALRILQIGYGPLAHIMTPRARTGGLDLTIVESDRQSFDRASAALGKESNVKLVQSDGIKQLGEYDVVVSVGGLHHMPAGLSLAGLKHALAPNGLLLALEPKPSFFRDVVFGVNADWFGGARQAVRHSTAAWRDELARAGFDEFDARELQIYSEAAILLCAKNTSAKTAEVEVETKQVKGDVRIIDRGRSPVGTSVLHELTAGGTRASISTIFDRPADGEAVHLVLLPTTSSKSTDDAEALLERCISLKEFAACGR